ncbi:MAG: restriction endonuclease [Microcella sp.]|uniref:McrC family protein n=1 Tax=Microcella sp. TaxID=1913979 RepID=UPI0033147737
MHDDLAAAITREGIAQVVPLGGGLWQVSNVKRVGAVRLDGWEVRVEPKVPIRNLFHLLARGKSWGDWWPDDLKLDDSSDFSTVIAEAFLSHAARALRGGVLHGYVEQREAAQTIRGRILMAEQIRRRTGVLLPVELQWDDFTADIAVNQLLRSATRRLIGAGRLRDRVRSGLLRLDLALAEASLLTRGARLPEVVWDRRSERYRSAVALAQLVLTNGSLDHRVGETTAKGFLLTLSKVFEEFVEAEVARAAAPWGGRIVAQERASLDVEGRIRIAPDLVWRDSSGPRAVFDAKYKAEKPSGFPNADVFQMIVYCIRLGLDTGHLIYAAGNEVPARYEIRNAGVTVVCHALRLDAPPAAISAQVDQIISGAAMSE